MKIKSMLKMLIISVGLGCGSGAIAVTVSSITPVVFEFDSSEIIIDTKFTSQGWGQIPISIAGSVDTDETLGGGKSYTVKFGSVAGGEQYGLFTYENIGFNRPINNLGGPIKTSRLMTLDGSLTLPAATSVFYATFFYVDDVYDVDYFQLGVTSLDFSFGATLYGELVESPTAVPLPAAFPMLGAGLLGLAALGRRQKRRKA